MVVYIKDFSFGVNILLSHIRNQDGYVTYDLSEITEVFHGISKETV